MSDYLKPIGEYLNTLQKNLDTGKATEPSYYSTLKILAESFGEWINALNEPKHIECGAPDFIVTRLMGSKKFFKRDRYIRYE